MESAERQRLRQLIEDKKAEWLAKHAPREITPERQAEIDTILNDIRKQIVTIQTGPNEYRITTRAGLAEELAARGVSPTDAERGVIFAGTLTKSVLMILPEESYLMSNIIHEDGTPIIAGVVGPQTVRQQLWKDLRMIGVTGRRVYVYRDADCGHAEEERRRLLHERLYPERQRA